jgi:hypothetical protein
MTKDRAFPQESRRWPRTAGLLLLAANLLWLIGCQGLSAAGSGQQQTSALTLAYPSLAFGNVTTGGSKTMTVLAMNSGSSSVTISSVSSSAKSFTITSPTVPAVVPAGGSTSLGVKFAPGSAGDISAVITISSDASNATATLSVSGTGVADGQLSASPSSKAFGSVVVGSKQTQTVTLTNNGGTSVTISNASISGTGFQLSGISTPVTVNASQSTTFIVTFAPQSAASVSGSVTITSDASNPTLTLDLTGTGVTAGALTSNPTSLPFGSVTTGTKQTLSETVTNTGGTSITISQVGITGTGLSLSGVSAPMTLNAGGSATFNVSFAPQATGAVSGNVTLTSSATNATLTIPVTGTGVTAGALGSNPTSLPFGSVTVGGKQTISETITNTGGTSVTISQAGISGSGFTLSGITPPVTLTAGQSAIFSVSFAPKSAGAVSGNVTISSNASNTTLTIPISGTGTAAAGQLSATPATLPLGNVTVGSSGTAHGTLTAGGANVTVTAASTNNSAFSVSGLSLPVTIPAGQSTSYTVTFSPQTAAAASATLTFTSNAQPTTTTEALTGTGTAASTHSVNLSWTASTSSSISGYNVYRTTYANSTCGSFSKINSVLDTTTLYTDSTVVNGTTYCYATTAVDSSSQESGYSNIVSNVQIPTT